ncbi:MAG: hypothetical protein ACFE8E_05665 [Candidatus Hodarchaeota archaeon]
MSHENKILIKCPRCGSLDCFIGEINPSGTTDLVCRKSDLGNRGIRIKVTLKGDHTEILAYKR